MGTTTGDDRQRSGMISNNTSGNCEENRRQVQVLMITNGKRENR